MDNLKSKVVEIVQGRITVFCNFCLRNTEELQFINVPGNNYDVDLRGQLLETFGSQFSEHPLSNHICMDCKQIIHQAYNFTKQVKNMRKLLALYLANLDSKITSLSTNIDNAKHNFSNVLIHLDDKATEECNVFLFKEENIAIKCDLSLESSDSDSKTNITDLLQTKQEPAFKAVCKFCFKIIDKHTLLTHYKTEHFNELLNINCNECNKTPCCHSKYFEHIKVLRKKGIFKLNCCDCKRNFKLKHQLLSHINTSHLNQSKYLCEFCTESFTSLENQQYHEYKYHSVKKECQFCDSSFKSKEELANHKLSCSKIKGEFCCEKCPVCFDSLDELIMHINKYHTKSSCDLSNKAFHQEKPIFKKESKEIPQNKSIKIKKNLTKRKLGKLKTRICHLCTDEFDSLKKLVHHLKANHRPDEVYKCNLCQKVFAIRNNFLSHIKSSTHLRKADPNFKPSFQCNDCDTSYSTMLLLERHRNARHLKILPYTCEKCGKAFAAKGNLKLHLTRHLQQKNYQCNFCSDFFTEPTGLKSHILRQHAPEKKKCACEQCGKTFISMSECKMHQLRQHSDKNYSCPLCDRKYHTNQNLRGHIKKVHFKNLSLTEYIKENGFFKDLQEVFRDRRAPCVVET